MEKLDMQLFNEIGYWSKCEGNLHLSLGIINSDDDLCFAVLDIVELSFSLKVYSATTLELLYKNMDLTLSDKMEVVATRDENTQVLQFGTERLILNEEQLTAFNEYLQEALSAKINKARNENSYQESTNGQKKVNTPYDTVIFIGKEYNIPADLPYYIELLSFFTEMQQDLISSGMRVIESVGYNLFEGQVSCSLHGLTYYTKCGWNIRNLDKYTDTVIEMLCNKGIFDRTKDDYLKNNNGYNFFKEMEEEVWQIYSTYYEEYSNDVECGKNSAYDQAVSKATPHKAKPCQKHIKSAIIYP